MYDEIILFVLTFHLVRLIVFSQILNCLTHSTPGFVSHSYTYGKYQKNSKTFTAT